MELLKEKNETLIEGLTEECIARMTAAKKQIENRKYSTARSELYKVTTLLDTLQTLDKGAKWADD